MSKQKVGHGELVGLRDRTKKSEFGLQEMCPLCLLTFGLDP